MRQALRYGLFLTLVGTSLGADRPAVDSGDVQMSEELGREPTDDELAEEVGVEADYLGFVRHVEPIQREGERVRTHYVIVVLAARWRCGEPRLSAEVDEIAWVDPYDLGGRPTTPELPEIVARAAAIVAR